VAWQSLRVFVLALAGAMLLVGFGFVLGLRVE